MRLTSARVLCSEAQRGVLCSMRTVAVLESCRLHNNNRALHSWLRSPATRRIPTHTIISILCAQSRRTQCALHLVLRLLAYSDSRLRVADSRYTVEKFVPMTVIGNATIISPLTITTEPAKRPGKDLGTASPKPAYSTLHHMYSIPSCSGSSVCTKALELGNSTVERMRQPHRLLSNGSDELRERAHRRCKW